MKHSKFKHFLFLLAIGAMSISFTACASESDQDLYDQSADGGDDDEDQGNWVQF
ncbi:hypothetical protein ABV409_08970 [Flagellimonas sp. DF-77]|uniref:hypothetical protein n=1 Tax=Flagellimonas algarum TaxID=3230298 RepID=UPI00339B008C